MDQAPLPAPVDRPPAWLPPALGRLWPHRRLVLASAVTVALALGIGTGFLTLMRPPPRPAPAVPQTPETGSQPAKPRQTVVLQPPLQFKVKTVPVTAGDAPGVDAFRPPLTLQAPYQVIDSTTFKSGDTTVRLAFLSGLGRDELCRAADGLRYACGLRGRAALARAIGGKRLVCWPVFGPSAGGRSYRCFADGADLGAEQARQGFARPLSAASDTVSASPSKARRRISHRPRRAMAAFCPNSTDEPEP